MGAPSYFDLAGRVAIVTGGARGNGAAVAAVLARCGTETLVLQECLA